MRHKRLVAHSILGPVFMGFGFAFVVTDRIGHLRLLRSWSAEGVPASALTASKGLAWFGYGVLGALGAALLVVGFSLTQRG